MIVPIVCCAAAPGAYGPVDLPSANRYRLLAGLRNINLGFPFWPGPSIEPCLLTSLPPSRGSRGQLPPGRGKRPALNPVFSPENRMKPLEQPPRRSGRRPRRGKTVQAGRPRGARPRRQCRVQLWLVRGDEITMRVTRHHRPIVSLLALALVLGAGFPARRRPVRFGSGRLCRERNQDPPDEPDPKGLHGRHGGRVPNRRGTSASASAARNDGSGYEVLLRETWSVCGGSRSGGPVGGKLSPPDGPICTEKLLSRFMLDGAG